MRALHGVVGLAFVAIFLATGVYMRSVFPAAYHDDAGMHMMFRATHIYILLLALLNLIVAAHWRPRQASWRRRTQIIGSLCLLIAPALVTASFFLEPAPQRFNRPLCLLAIALAFVGTLLHCLVPFREEAA
jgi:hypothetical protein